MPDKANLESEFEKAIESDDNEGAALKLAQIENLDSEGPAESTGPSLTKEQLGIGAFVPVLAALSVDEIESLQVAVIDADDLSAMFIPGTSIFDAEHRIHLTQRGDVKRAARGLAIAAAGGVDLDSRAILSNSGRTYTIREDGVCIELQTTKQPIFGGDFVTINNEEECKGHLKYKKSEGKGFELAGGSHMRCLHQHGVMFQLGYFVTASKSTFFDSQVVTTEIAQRVGDESARAMAAKQIEQWVGNTNDRREIRTGFAQAITAQKNELGLADSSYLPPSQEIGGIDLPTGETVAAAVIDLKGRQFALTVRIPLNGKTVDVTTRTCKNMSELASAVAPHFAVAKQNNGALLALELVAR